MASRTWKLKMYLKVQQLSRKTRTVIILIMIFTTIFIFNSNLKSDRYRPAHLTRNVGKPPKPVDYLINTTHCKIPKLNPFNEEVVPYVWKEETVECSDKPILTYVEQTSVDSKLKINQSVIHLYNRLGLSCCYSYILRDNGDFSLSYSACVHFENEVQIDLPHVIVECRNVFFWKVYENVHAAIQPESYVLKTSSKPVANKWRIIMLGIDSMSNLNLQRTMPKVHTLLEKEFIGFRGYNKIEDNTFPNLMAILTGRSYSNLGSDCRLNETFDRCNLIWREFANRGYVTAYGEDEPTINTFTLSKRGFAQPPTDVYLRPYFLAAYKLSTKTKYYMTVCSGPESTASRMFNAAKSFLDVFKTEPIFAFYWLNSFSHGGVNEPTAIEEMVSRFLASSALVQAMDNSIVVIFSDHGFRFGDIRLTYSGWFEERLPFMYVRFPKLFQDTYPDFVRNFAFNAEHRLTTPYDFYMTLQHILSLTDPTYSIQPSHGCPNCHSLFKPVSINRTCEDAGIEQHWCTCGGYNSIPVTDPQVVQVASFIVSELNGIIQDEDESYKCAEYSVRSIESAGVSESAEERTFLLIVETYPYAIFEATARWSNGRFTLLGSLSRLNKYKIYSECVSNGLLKKYCFCDRWFNKMVNHVCYVLNLPCDS